ILLKHQKNFLLIILSVVVIIISFVLIKNSLNTRKKGQAYSIAVLPIKNLSDDNANQYFADGVMDDIMNHLSSIKEFKIISRTTMEQYRETQKTAPEIAKKLKVNYIIESSIQKYKDSVMVIVQLIDAKKDKHLWSKKFEREFINIFALESEIAKEIAEELKVTLSPSEIKQIETNPTENIEAYTLYLRGRFFWNQKTKKDLERSIFYFNQALQLDSTYALAYSGLADTYLHMAGWGWYNRMKGLVKAKEFATKALFINNNIAESHATLGALLAYGQWKWDAGENEFKLAIALNPNYAAAHEYYSMLLDVMGRTEEARKEIDIALQLNPYSVTVNQLSSIYYFRSEDYDKALEKKLENQKNFKNHPLEYSNNIRLYIMQKKYSKAVEELKQILKSDPLTQKYADTVQIKYKKSGIKEVYRWWLQNDIKNNYEIYFIAEKYAFLGENDNALTLLEKCYKSRSIWAPYMKCNPFFKNLQSEPRFKTILKEMNLDD
ncbi:MAG: hypothetical protein J7K34_05615, partial [Flavobacteriaceae bacterium]|nr:hypothetical protein [Flavobacteriaceae bacterium]